VADVQPLLDLRRRSSFELPRGTATAGMVPTSTKQTPGLGLYLPADSNNTGSARCAKIFLYHSGQTDIDAEQDAAQ
jgi:hypothetical protein